MRPRPGDEILICQQKHEFVFNALEGKNALWDMFSERYDTHCPTCKTQEPYEQTKKRKR